MSLKKLSQKQFCVPSSGNKEVMHIGEEADNSMKKSTCILEKQGKLWLLNPIHERLKKVETESNKLKDTVAQIKNGVNSIKKDVEEAKMATVQKADKSKVKALEKEVKNFAIGHGGTIWCLTMCQRKLKEKIA